MPLSVVWESNTPGRKYDKRLLVFESRRAGSGPDVTT